MLFRFVKIDSPPCSFSKMIDKTPLHLFYNCTKTKLFRDQLKEFMSNIVCILSLTPQGAILGHIGQIIKHESKKRSKYLKKWRPFIDYIV